MTFDPQVDLIFSHFIPRYEATGVDPNDLRKLMRSIGRWEDWCRLWSDEAARHEKLAEEAAAQDRAVTAADAYVRAAIYYHYGKHLFAEHPAEFRAAHDAMLRCYSTGATKLANPVERIEFPFRGVAMPGWPVRRSPLSCPASMPARRSSMLGLRPLSNAGWRHSHSTGRGREKPRFTCPRLMNGAPFLAL